MSTYTYGPTWAGCDRADILSRDRGPWVRPEPYIGRLHLALPGCEIDWVLRQDMRDMRRFYALDLDGQRLGHAAPRELIRTVLMPRVPVYAGQNG